MRVLILDDDPLRAAAMALAAEAAGHDVAGVARTARDALRLAAAAPPDVAVCAVRLRGPLSGIEAAALLAARHGCRLVFACSAPGIVERRRIEALGPLAMLEEPSAPSGLAGVLRRLAGSRAAA
jgi:DNA-binding NarL/FixJ family response regulator